MRFLIDESCDAAIAEGLRKSGHDVVAVAESFPGAPDARVISVAVGDSRVLVTEDKDFGQLVFASGHGHGGVILLRYPHPLAAHMVTRLLDSVGRYGERVHGCFVVVQPGKTRFIRHPALD